LGFLSILNSYAIFTGFVLVTWLNTHTHTTSVVKHSSHNLRTENLSLLTPPPSRFISET